MRCRECGTVTPYPICAKCASNEEQTLLDKLSNIDDTNKTNKKNIIKNNLKLPTVTPLLFILIIFFVALIVLTLFIADKIDNPFLQILTPIFIPFFGATIVIYWGEMPLENVANGIKTVDLKQDNLTVRRHRKEYIRLLKKPYNNWSIDDRLRVSFKSLEM